MTKHQLKKESHSEWLKIYENVYIYAVDTTCNNSNNYQVANRPSATLHNILVVAVSRGYDTCFSGKACDGLCLLLKSTGLVETP